MQAFRERHRVVASRTVYTIAMLKRLCLQVTKSSLHRDQELFERLIFVEDTIADTRLEAVC